MNAQMAAGMASMATGGSMVTGGANAPTVPDASLTTYTPSKQRSSLTPYTPSKQRTRPRRAGTALVADP